MLNEGKVVVQVSVVCSLYGLKVKPDQSIQLSEEFLKDLKSLEEEEGGERKGGYGVNFLIKKWGTHWRSRVFIGGRVSMSFFVDEELANLHSMDFVNKQAESYFMKYVGAQPKEDVLEEFLASTSISELEILGGDPTLLHPPPLHQLSSPSTFGWKAWTQTIIDNPAIIWEELVPIETILGDQIAPKVKERLAMGIRKYLYKKGCTHPYAKNYNPSATIDDGSCMDPVVVPERMRCKGSGRISMFTPNCLETRVSNQSLQIFCVDGVTRFCLSSQSCPWKDDREEGGKGVRRREGRGEEGRREEGGRDERSCLQEGLSSDWMATIICGQGWRGGRHVFCGGEEKAYLK